MRLSLMFSKLLHGEYNITLLLYRLFKNRNMPEIVKKMDNNKQNKTPVTRITAIAYDGFSQNTHPSVIHNDNLYILAASPFPFSDAMKENPCVYTSSNGVDFISCKNMPIAEPESESYFSDPEIIFSEGKYHVYYRAWFSKITTAKIYKSTSEDLEKWSTPLLLCETQDNFLSPSVCISGMQKYIYAINISDNGEKKHSKLCRYTEIQNKISDKKTLKVNNVPSGKYLWHACIKNINNKNIALFTISEDLNGNNSKLYYAIGNDSATEFTIKCKIDICNNEEKYFNNIYKASCVYMDDTLNIYVSAKDKRMAWHIYKIDFTGEPL